jgi:hypothetical protein
MVKGLKGKVSLHATCITCGEEIVEVGSGKWLHVDLCGWHDHEARPKIEIDFGVMDYLAEMIGSIEFGVTSICVWTANRQLNSLGLLFVLPDGTMELHNDGVWRKFFIPISDYPKVKMNVCKS